MGLPNRRSKRLKLAYMRHPSNLGKGILARSHARLPAHAGMGQRARKQARLIRTVHVECSIERKPRQQSQTHDIRHLGYIRERRLLATRTAFHRCHSALSARDGPRTQSQ